MSAKGAVSRVTLVDDWAAKCSATDRGRIFLDNLGIDLGFGFLKDPELKRFAKGLSAAASGGGATHSEPYVAVATRAIERRLLYLRGRKINRSRRALACLFSFDEILAGLWFDMSRVGILTDMDGPEEIFHKVSYASRRAGGLGPILRPGSALRGRLPLVWLAFDAEV
jgi:hypothetical protein